MRELNLFEPRKTNRPQKIRPIKPLRLSKSTKSLVKTGVELAIIGAAVGIGLGAYKKASGG